MEGAGESQEEGRPIARPDIKAGEWPHGSNEATDVRRDRPGGG